MKCIASFLLAVLCLYQASAQPSSATVKQPGERIVYKKVGDRETELFLFKPADWKASDRRPAIVFFHGGGWVGGTAGQFNEHCKYFASRGLVCATVEYRLVDKKTKEPPTNCIADAKSAMRWMRGHGGELGIDTDRIAAAGGSAGGHLAAFCGMAEGLDDPADSLKISPKPNALILFNPVFNNGPGQWGHTRVGDAYKQFSPAHNITADDPPAVVFLGSRDHLISVDTAKEFQSEMKKLGIKSVLHVYEGQGHGFYGKNNANGKYQAETLIEADKFLADLGWLKGPPTMIVPAAVTKAKQ